MDLAESKVLEKAVYHPGASTIEGSPTKLQFFRTHPAVMPMPHWHAQVEVNYVISGHVHYRMGDHALRLEAGQMCLFWGGQAHQMDESSDDSFYAGAHLPLVHFFRMRLPASVSSMLMGGATMLTSVTDTSDEENFSRWFRYVNSGDAQKSENAVEELLLRVERIFLEPYSVVASAPPDSQASDTEGSHSLNVVRMCDFIAANFLEDVDATDIARSASLHPKYAMNLFRKSTGMTLIKYLTLLRLSRAQAMLIENNDNILHVALESGFGSVSAFNKAFRQVAGMSPSDFRRDMRISIV
ncbi:MULTISPECIES: helix-turn-helix domain-containing protein [Agrobacterium]|uniref:Helix-turn-helix domain-containing protein n=1 Tax=Agrobacterium rosae TaxID=1972867 RepID=A0A1R3TR93_9HYPH|nr:MULTISPECIES: helix-turn-helix domain-containing protein [Agrobacterium]MBN7806845.1 helix-turn-helix domain-containing protein [Agrobacterium rosae]MDX8303981.1 helix-turn-helix domain-containing protein [Agrobacterium rosae]MDX8314099.1 helix-turn-helix domain-containing protein [Agrobacterium rosae]SCX11771.1 Melibiose operon regulatory protein [Agrobacterium sp. DSM 25558]SCX23680.1 Melibiose operon regulatory protein [Agrobacterium rosae]